MNREKYLLVRSSNRVVHALRGDGKTFCGRELTKGVLAYKHFWISEEVSYCITCRDAGGLEIESPETVTYCKKCGEEQRPSYRIRGHDHYVPSDRAIAANS